MRTLVIAIAASSLITGCGVASQANDAPAPTPPPIATRAATTHRVVRVIDGDTIVVMDARSGTSTVRLIGIDAPEWTTKKECGGAEATGLVRELLKGGQVTLVGDSTQGTLDRYDRPLVYVQVPILGDLGRALLVRGRAYEYTYNPSKPYRRQLEYRTAEAAAKTQSVGVWSECPAPTATPYRNCAAARKDGAAPLRRGEPGYNPKLDGDGDGIACE